MKTMKDVKMWLVMSAVALLPLMANGQKASKMNPAVNKTSYSKAIGIRGGETSGITFKQFMNNGAAIEGIVGIWNHGLSLTGLYELHGKLGNTPGLQWYYGAGGHVVFFADHTKGYYYMHHWKDNQRSGQTGLGIDGVLGFEYKPRPIPFAISVDAKPYVEVLSGGSTWFALDPSIGIKLAF